METIGNRWQASGRKHYQRNAVCNKHYIAWYVYHGIFQAKHKCVGLNLYDFSFKHDLQLSARFPDSHLTVAVVMSRHARFVVRLAVLARELGCVSCSLNRFCPNSSRMQPAASTEPTPGQVYQWRVLAALYLICTRRAVPLPQVCEIEAHLYAFIIICGVVLTDARERINFSVKGSMFIDVSEALLLAEPPGGVRFLCTCLASCILSQSLAGVCH